MKNRRYVPTLKAGVWHYGPWRIRFEYPPIPDRRFDWEFTHEDYEPGDNRHGYAKSLWAALEECDAIEDGEA